MKLKLLASAVLIAGSLGAVAQTRMTLHEEFTGENCPPCASTNPGFWSFCNSNAAKMLHITYLAPIPSTGKFYQSQQTALSARQTYYSVPFAPYGRYDGAAISPSCGSPAGSAASHPGCMVQADVDTRAAVASPFNMTATYYTSHDTVFGKVKIKAVTAKASNFLRLRVAFTRTYSFTTSPGTNGETTYENVVRKMFVCNGQSYPGTDGTYIDSSWAVGDSATYTYVGTISNLDTSFSVIKPFTKTDSSFVVWIQEDNSTKEIHQAAKSTWYVPPPPTGVTAVASSVRDLNIFPNPAQSNISVKCQLIEAGEVTVTISNALGQSVFTRQYAATGRDFDENVSIGNLSNGVYLLSLSADGTRVTKQFTVSK